MKGLFVFAEEFPEVTKIVVSLNERRKIDESGVEIIPAFEFLSQLWKDQVL